ncbi:MAG: sugar-binding domain-containing protein [Streptococcus salivarius]
MFVWVNGNFVGYSEDSFTPSEFEISDYLVEGDNKLAVAVYRYSTASWLEDQDFWRLTVFSEMFTCTLFQKFTFKISLLREIMITKQKQVNWILI